MTGNQDNMHEQHVGDGGAITGPLSPQAAPQDWSPPQQPVSGASGHGPRRGRWRHGQRHRHGGILGPLMLILLGVLFLLNNFGIVGWNVWGRLWRLWPLVLVGLGLELLLGRRNPLFSGAILALMVVAGILFLYLSGM